MKVCFVCSGTRGVSPIIKAQADSLRALGVELSILPISKGGLWGYISSIPYLRKQIASIKPDVVHAHYSLCGIVASAATCRPIVVSLMGSDMQVSGVFKRFIAFLARHNWKATIVKSNDMKNKLCVPSIQVIPNGVDLSIFRPLDKIICRKRLGWNTQDFIVLFAANPARPEKNFHLAQRSFNRIHIPWKELKIVYGIDHSDMPYFLNAADVLLVTSLWEGSPNVVKEAMACNLPIVSVNVGDVAWLFGQTPGYSLVKHSEEEIVCALGAVVGLDLATGRDRISALQLDSPSVAKRLLGLYADAMGFNV